MLHEDFAPLQRRDPGSPCTGVSVRAIAEKADVSIHSCTEGPDEGAKKTALRKFLVTGEQQNIEHAVRIMTAALERFTGLWDGTAGWTPSLRCQACS